MKKTFGIIGKPLSHSLSPILHNYWFKKYKIDATYSTICTTEILATPKLARPVTTFMFNH